MSKEEKLLIIHIVHGILAISPDTLNKDYQDKLLKRCKEAGISPLDLLTELKT